MLRDQKTNSVAQRVGLDIGSHTIKAVEVVERGTELVLRSAASVALPRTRGREEQPNPSAVVQSLKTLWASAGFTSKKVVLSLSCDSIYMKWLNLEAENDEALDQIARQAATRGAPFPTEDAIVDYRVLKSRGTASSNVRFVLLVTASASAVDELLNYKQAGGDTIVEVTTIDMGRDPNRLQELSAATGVKIIAATGFYKGKRVSVMASGMGMPAIGIYSYELFNFYNVKNIIRIGSAGAINTDLHLRDLVIAIGACTNSNFASQYSLPGTFAPVASYDLLKKAVETAEKEGVNYKAGNILSSDTFYDDSASAVKWQKMGVLAVEMEAAALYMNAARAGKNALCICTISDCLFTGEECSALERQNSFTKMIEIALQIA
jgi:purine-nucleoside phosphorylase